MTEKTRDIYVSGGIALGSLIFLTWVIPTFTPPYPGYGVSSALLPNIVLSIILGLSLLSMGASIFSTWKTKSSEDGKGPPVQKGINQNERIHFGHLVSFMTPCILLMPAMKWMGFIPAGLLFILLIQYLCGQRKPLTMVIVSVCTVGFIYLAMRYGLGVPMP